MPNRAFDTRYFNWLCREINDQSRRSTLHRELLRQLSAYEFVWLILGDDNRMADCLDLRFDFLRSIGLDPGTEFAHATGYSVLEVLVAFSRRASFNTEQPHQFWFWLMIENLGLDDINLKPSHIDHILWQFVWRQYDRKGRGGLFPMPDSTHDQREVEIWYQFCEYVDVNGIL